MENNYSLYEEVKKLIEQWEKNLVEMKATRMPDIHTRSQLTYEIMTKQQCLQDLRKVFQDRCYVEYDGNCG